MIGRNHGSDVCSSVTSPVAVWKGTTCTRSATPSTTAPTTSVDHASAIGGSATSVVEDSTKYTASPAAASSANSTPRGSTPPVAGLSTSTRPTSAATPPM